MLTNMALIVGLARTFDADGFGRFALLYGLAQIAVGISRSTTADVAAASYGSEVDKIDQVRRAVAMAMLGRLTIAIPLLAVAAFLVFEGFSLVGAVLTLGVLPLGFHELWRQLSFARLDPTEAVRLDLLWLVAGASLWLIGLAVWGNSPELMIAAWIFGAVCGASYGARHLLGERSESTPNDWAERSRADGPAYAMEFLLSRGTPEVVGWSLAITAGIAEAGSFRLAQTLLGPLSVLIGGLRGTFVGELRRVMRSTGKHLRMAASTSLVFCALPLLYLLALRFVPESFGEQLVGNQWMAAMAIAPYLAFRRSASAASIPPFLLLRILGKAKTTSTIRLVEAGVNVALILTGSLIAGATGALVGYAAAGLVNLAIWWLIARRTDGESITSNNSAVLL